MKKIIKNWRFQLKRLPGAAKLNARLKAFSVEREAAAIYRRHEGEAYRRGIRALYAEELEAAVRRRVAERAFRLGWPKQKGDLHIFLSFGNWNWESILPKSLSSLGKVTAFEWRSRGFREEHPAWTERRDQMNRAMLDAFHNANERRPVDVVVGYLSGLTVSPETLVEMARAGATIANFCFDDKRVFPGTIVDGRYESTAAIASVIDLNLTSDPGGILKYAVHGGLAAFHPEAADPDLHRPHVTPFEIDVSFVGANYGWRSEFIMALKHLGIDVVCFGAGWPNGPVVNEDMAKIYSKSRINLGFGGIGHSRKLCNLKGRDFEVPMSGGLYLTQDNPELAQVYTVGKDIVTYRDETDCARMIGVLLGEPQLADSIRRSGHATARQKHTYEMRWTKMLRTFGALA